MITGEYAFRSPPSTQTLPAIGDDDGAEGRRPPPGAVITGHQIQPVFNPYDPVLKLRVTATINAWREFIRRVGTADYHFPADVPLSDGSRQLIKKVYDYKKKRAVNVYRKK
jgi:hypothetical protein